MHQSPQDATPLEDHPILVAGAGVAEDAGRVRQPDVVTALITTALAVVIGLLVVNMMRGDAERATTGAVVIVGISLAIGLLRGQGDR